MFSTYSIARCPQGWAVLEDGELVEVHPDRDRADEVRRLLFHLNRAVAAPSATRRADAAAAR